MVEQFLSKAKEKINRKYIVIFAWIATAFYVFISFCGIYYVINSAINYGHSAYSTKYLIEYLIKPTTSILLLLHLYFPKKFKAQIVFPVIFVLLLLFTGNPICIVATISALNGFKRKRFTLLALLLSMIWSVLCTWWGYIGWYMYATIITRISLYIALALYSIKYEIPAVIKEEKLKNFFATMKLKTTFESEPDLPEQKLKLLNTKLEAGVITEEEYQEKRAEIINSL